ncbi:hypothetical protein BCR33DRAFT_758962 [Rhizoclosmatium globosum]|uniref:Uncharacterized protein n=1 Tax=Rhizoclosmatium globosum TaxID=329046 RepID=A0A1Y2BPY1_9FUNG|nr:hypothetical protein BCR33DRAFT_758962 [Rhizoclosmatium globosum]|eukprot:ORY36809.1 hypothetical protein BCR33DRAFT_758962 [Rhizoclosmatium globosum]
MTKMPGVTFQIRLETDGSPSERKKYVRLPPPLASNPYRLRFVITSGSRVASATPALHSNHVTHGTTFKRSLFHARPFESTNNGDFVVELSMDSPGVFEYFVQGKDGTRGTSGFVVVDPRLTVPNKSIKKDANDQKDILLPLDAVCVLTVIPKWMPVVDKWPAYFESFAESGYNMIHYAPLNTRGDSNSPYSIYDQLSLSYDLFGSDRHLDEKIREKKLGDILKLAHSEYGILSITDVVWNHTAHNSAWLQEHPEAGYNLETAPHLRSAFELDEAIMGLWKDLTKAGIPLALRTEEHLTQIMNLFKDTVLPRLRLWEFYVVNVANSVAEFKKLWTALKHAAAVALMERLIYPNTDVESVLKTYTDILNEVNSPFYKEHDEDVAAIINNVWNRARFFRVDPHGPKLGPISEHDPFVDTYFTRLPLTVATHQLHPDARCLANNGWIWNGDPLQNFAGPHSKAYLRRDVIAWGDCVKLRYGDGPECNPWLWAHQKEYTEKMARLFHGFRIDNCHSTPIHVAAYLLDAARVINPDLYVFAELFTGSEETDVKFVSQLGINSLIREAMSAWDPKEMSRLVHRYGGTPIGSLTSKEEYFPLDMLGHTLDSAFFSPVSEGDDIVVDVKGSSTHALFMDCTHDNETPHQKRTAEDTLPTAALVAMTSCAVGSVKGYDEVVPELLNVVTETRRYRNAEAHEGIIPAKSILLHTHAKMAREGYTEIHVHQEHDFISVHRVHPITHDGYLLIARCAFSKHHGSEVHSPIVLRNQSVHIIESAGLRVQAHLVASSSSDDLLSNSGPYGPHDSEAIAHARDERARVHGRKTIGAIAGLPCFLDFSAVLTTLVNSREEQLHGDNQGMQTILTINGQTFLPGSIVLYRTWMKESGMNLVVPDVTMSPIPPPMRMAVDLTQHGGPSAEPSPLLVRKLVMKPPQRDTIVDGIQISDYDLGCLEKLWKLMGVDNRNRGAEIMIQMGRDVLDSGLLAFTEKRSTWPPGLWEAVEDFGVEDVNIALFRCGTEEQDAIGDGVYDIPGHGPLPYCGLQGFMSVIQKVARNNDLGHAICSNLRAGPWMMEYVVGRLNKYSAQNPKVLALANWFSERFAIVKNISPSFVPKYFFQIIFLAYNAVRFHVIRRVSQTAAKFICPDTSSLRVSSLETLSQALLMTTHQVYGRVTTTSLFPVGKYPESPFNNSNGIASMAAGLPHFASRHMRCWGRDIFISLPGLLLVPGYYDAAKSHLIAFGSVLRHGLIPNLLDQGTFPRYNARDATWWWLWGVQQYCKQAPEGLAFLGVTVKRRFPPKRRYRQGADYLKVDETDDVPGDEGDIFVSVDDPKAYAYESTIGELCHEIFERHARGIQFKEWNAGPNLDHAMRDVGFEVQCGTRFEDGTGIVFGGNRYNCGTWMDKMGDSEKAGTKGLPATPRDGAPVEIVGLLKAALRWVVEDVLSSPVGKKVYPASTVVAQGEYKFDCLHFLNDALGKTVSYIEWNSMLLKSFEKYYYIPKFPQEDKDFKLGAIELINRRGIYKDTLNSSQPYTDFQFRPNFCVALVVAPELFDPDHARIALDAVKESLLGPLGIKTLDPKDWAYRGVYDNANDSDDSSVAHGFNYHNGPEWGWVVGFFLRAYLYFHTIAPGSNSSKKSEVIGWIQSVLLNQKNHIFDLDRNPFAGLPELTNADGQYCHHSCPTQAWSSATLLELLADIQK